MKKVLISMILTALCSAVILLISACDRREDHDHTFEEWTTVSEPTCTQPGAKKAGCMFCGTTVTRPLDPLGHDYSGEPVSIIEATCQNEGEMRYECKHGCNGPKIEYLPRGTHDYSGEEITVPATCTTKGERRVKCIIHCDSEKVTILSVLGHQYDEVGTVTKPATCETDGERTFTCERCFQKFTEKIEALGHEYGNYVVDKASSLTEDGQKSRHCYQKLSELMRGKKGAYLYFFYVGCGACSSQFPVFVNEYDSFGEAKKDLLVIMINVHGEQIAGQTREDMQNYKSKYPSEFLMTSGKFEGVDLFTWVEHPYDGVPRFFPKVRMKREITV